MVLRSPQSVQYKRIPRRINSFNMPDQKEQEMPLQDVKPPTEPKSTNTPPMTEDLVSMGEAPPGVVPSAVPTAE